MKKLSFSLALIILLSSFFAFTSSSFDFLVGDINRDTKINAQDTNIMTRIITGNYGKYEMCCADVNEDSKISPADLSLLKKSIIGEYVITQPNDKTLYTDRFSNTVMHFTNEEMTNMYISTYTNTLISFSEKENAPLFKATSTSDASVNIDLSNASLTCDDISSIIIVYKATDKGSRRPPLSSLSLSVNNGSYMSTSSQSIIKGDKYEYCSFSVSELNFWSGTLSGLRLKYFVSCKKDDEYFLDSIIFIHNSDTKDFSVAHRIYERNGMDSIDITIPWTEYRTLHQDENNYEYISGSGIETTLNFRYSSKEALTSNSLSARLSRAILKSTGYEINCQIYDGIKELLSNWYNDTPSAYISYTIYYGNNMYNVYIKTNIIKDSSYTDELDSSKEEIFTEYTLSEVWNNDNISLSSPISLPLSTASLASHSNSENRLVNTPYGTFAVYPSSDNDCSIGDNNAEMTIYMIKDNETIELGTYTYYLHSSKPSIYYADDGLVYVIQGDVTSEFTFSTFVAYFDPSSPNENGLFDIIASREDMYFTYGGIPGGYGYAQAIMNPQEKLFSIYFCGGKTSGYFAWVNYNYSTHLWESSNYSVELPEYRHCYIYGYPDGNGGVYIVAGRDVLLSTIGLDNIIYGAEYAWDQVTIFHFLGAHSKIYTSQVVTFADYSQTYAELYPNIYNNSTGDVYISEDGYLHILTTKKMHTTNHHEVVYIEHWYNIYDIKDAGSEPKLIYRSPISFGERNTEYTSRFINGPDNSLYIVAMKLDSNRCEIWKQESETKSFNLVANYLFEGPKINGGLIVANNRNGSTYDNGISLMYPTLNTVYNYISITFK